MIEEGVESWIEIGGGVLLGIAAQPIHEGGHAVVTRLLTGAWPHLGFWAVYPVHSFSSKLDTAIVLAAGDLAVLGWWAVLFLLVRRRPRFKSALIGPTFVLAVVLVNWLASAALFPFGQHNLGASDAAKFLSISGIAPRAVVAFLIAVAATVSIVATRLFRMAAPPSEQVDSKFRK